MTDLVSTTKHGSSPWVTSGFDSVRQTNAVAGLLASLARVSFQDGQLSANPSRTRYRCSELRVSGERQRECLVSECVCAFSHPPAGWTLFTPWRTASTSRSTRGRWRCRPRRRRTTPRRRRSGRGGNGKRSPGRTGSTATGGSSWPDRAVSSLWHWALLSSPVAFSSHSSE